MTSFHSHAVAFLRTFEIGRVIRNDEFDAWAIERGLMQEPEDRSTNSIPWAAHLQFRYHTRRGINVAACKRRMLEEGHQTFAIEYVGQDAYEVKAAHQALIENNAARKIKSLTKTKRRQLLRLKEGIYRDQLEPYSNDFIDTLADDIEDFEARITIEATQLDKKCKKLAERLQLRIDAGTLRPDPQLSLLKLLGPPDEEPEEDEE
jgi:hypothetical protein